MRKTARMEELERQHGRPIEVIVANALSGDKTLEQVADEIGISRQTLELWKAKLRIQTERLVRIG